MTSSRPLAKRVAVSAVFPPFEALWSAGFATLGRLRPGHRVPRRWLPSGGALAVVVAAHPDDETVAAGGVTALHLCGGDRVVIVAVSDGRRSRAGGLDAPTMARLRSAEIEAAAAALGGPDLVQLGLREGCWERQHLVEQLAPFLDQADIVYAPSCVDYHPEHVLVASAVASMVRADQVVRVYQIGVPLTVRLTNLIADISAVRSRKQRALACYATQADTLATVGRLSHYLASFYRLPDVEVFWELAGDQYADAMNSGSTMGSFRGLRQTPIGDPLAWLIGGRRRARLWSVANKSGAGNHRAARVLDIPGDTAK